LQGGSSITRFGVEEQNHLRQGQQADFIQRPVSTQVVDLGANMQLKTVSKPGSAHRASKLTGDLSRNLLSATLAPSAAGSIR